MEMPMKADREDIGMRIQKLLWCAAAFLFLLSIGCPLSAAEQAAVQPPKAPGQATPDSGPLVPPDIERILKRGKLLVAMFTQNTRPFYFTDEKGELNGIDVHLIKGFARQLGVDIEFDRSSTTLNGVIDKVVRREADVGISKLSKTFARTTRVRFTDPYIMLHQGLLVNRLEIAKQRQGRDRADAIKGLQGKLGVLAKSSYVDNAKEWFKQAEVVEYNTWDEVVAAAASGEVVAAYRDEVEVKQIVRDRPDAALQFMTVVLTDARDPKGMVVAWDSHLLLSALNFYIESLDLQLTADMVLNEYDKIIAKIESRTQH